MGRLSIVLYITVLSLMKFRSVQGAFSFESDPAYCTCDEGLNCTLTLKWNYTTEETVTVIEWYKQPGVLIARIFGVNKGAPFTVLSPYNAYPYAVNKYDNSKAGIQIFNVTPEDDGKYSVNVTAASPQSHVLHFNHTRDCQETDITTTSLTTTESLSPTTTEPPSATTTEPPSATTTEPPSVTTTEPPSVITTQQQYPTTTEPTKEKCDLLIIIILAVCCGVQLVINLACFVCWVYGKRNKPKENNLNNDSNETGNIDNGYDNITARPEELGVKSFNDNKMKQGSIKNDKQ